MSKVALAAVLICSWLTSAYCNADDDPELEAIRRARQLSEENSDLRLKIIDLEGERDRAVLERKRLEALNRINDFFLIQAPPITAKSPHEIRWEPEFIFLHAPGRIRYRIPDDITEFSAVGELRVQGQVKFIVKVDDKERFRSNSIRQGGSVEIHVRIPKGSSTLEIISDSDGIDYFDHALWVNPQFGPIPKKFF